MDLLNDYILQFIEHQKCHRHSTERAKLIKLKCNFKESFICSQCLEIDNINQQSIITIKRASDMLTNFILYDTPKIHNQIEHLREKLKRFIDMFNDLLKQLDNQIQAKESQIQALKKPYYQKVNELERMMRHVQNTNSQKQVDVQQQLQATETLKGTVLLLLQNDEFLSQCSKKESNDFTSKLQKRYDSIERMINEATTQLSQLIEQSTHQPLSRKPSQADSSELISPAQKHLCFSTFTSQLSKNLLSPYSFKQVHPDFKLLSPTKLQVPVTNQNTRVVRLALVGPRLQDGPLKPPKSITFYINQQIQSAFQVGVCESGSTVLDISKPHKLFSASKYPYFSRGDNVTLTVNPATGFIQLIKNKVFNQPIQFELQLECWTNMVFVVACQDCSGGGGEIEIIYDE